MATNSALAEEVVGKLFMTAEGRANPYPLYHQLRELAPVHRNQLGIWILSRYEDCWSALRDPRLGKDFARQVAQRFGESWREQPALADAEHSMLNTTGAEHTRLRKLVTRSFTPRMIQNMRPVIERTIDELLEPIAAAGGGNILEQVGFPLPVTIIGEMLGVPRPDRAQFRAPVRELVAIFELQPTAAQIAAANAAQRFIHDYFLALVQEKRRQPGEDLLSALVNTTSDGDRLDDEEIVTMAALLFEAGFETTTNLFGNGLLALLRHPEQIAALRADAALFANLPDELLRYDGSVQLTTRFTEAEIELGGVTIPAGEQVFTLLGAGNHDPARFAEPDRLDLTRSGIPPLTFGGGVHFCLGAALARTEIEIVFTRVLGRFEAIELRGEPRFADRLALRGLESLEVECRVAATRSVAPVAPSAPTPRAAESAPAAPSGGALPQKAEADLRWRTELRQRIESEPKRPDSVPVRTGPRLAATMNLLSSHPLFRRCTAAELGQLAATAYPMSFEPGDMLCIEGADSQECYVIEVGQATVSIGGKGVGSVGESDIVGERGVLLDRVRSASVTATTHMITYAISRQRLRGVITNNPKAREWMLAEMQRRYPNVADS